MQASKAALKKRQESEIAAKQFHIETLKMFMAQIYKKLNEETIFKAVEKFVEESIKVLPARGDKEEKIKRWNAALEKVKAPLAQVNAEFTAYHDT